MVKGKKFGCEEDVEIVVIVAAADEFGADKLYCEGDAQDLAAGGAG